MHKTSTKEKMNEKIKRKIPNRKVGLNNNYDIEVQKSIGNNSVFMVMKHNILTTSQTQENSDTNESEAKLVNIWFQFQKKNILYMDHMEESI